MKINSKFNDMLSFLSFNWKLLKPLNKPMVRIETTNICNLDCLMCTRNRMTRRQGVMSLQDFKKIVDKLSSGTSIFLYWLGEPLIDKTIFEKIEYCYNKGMNTTLSTNITLLNEENSSKLLKTHLNKLILSMDGFKKETYESIRFGADFETAKNNIILFMKMREQIQSRQNVTLQILRTKETQEELNDYIKYWNKFNFSKIYIKNIVPWGNTVVSNIEKNKRVINPCFSLWYSIIICWDGDIVVCCGDYNKNKVLGNIFTDDLMKIWNGEFYIRLRKEHNTLSIKNPLCKNCVDMPFLEQSPYLFNENNIKRILNYLRTGALG